MRVEVTGGSVTVVVVVPQVVVVGMDSLGTGVVGVGRFVTSARLQAVEDDMN